jgi:sarcosine oxidase subunit gamma
MTPLGSGDGVTVRLLGPAVVSVLARKDQTGQLLEAAKERFGLVLRDEPMRALAGDVSALGIGPGRWLFLGAEMNALAASLGNFASLSDHGDGYAIFEISGPKVRQVLAKGVAVDLDPDIFTDDVAVTVIAHIGAIVWRTGADQFAVAVFRSYAASFWHWLSISAAEFGLAAGEFHDHS